MRICAPATSGVVNIFGSWCEAVHFEHRYLMALAADPELKAKGRRDLWGCAKGLG